MWAHWHPVSRIYYNSSSSTAILHRKDTVHDRCERRGRLIINSCGVLSHLPTNTIHSHMWVHIQILCSCDPVLIITIGHITIIMNKSYAILWTIHTKDCLLLMLLHFTFTLIWCSKHIIHSKLSIFRSRLRPKLTKINPLFSSPKMCSYQERNRLFRRLMIGHLTRETSNDFRMVYALNFVLRSPVTVWALYSQKWSNQIVITIFVILYSIVHV